MAKLLNQRRHLRFQKSLRNHAVAVPCPRNIVRSITCSTHVCGFHRRASTRPRPMPSRHASQLDRTASTQFRPGSAADGGWDWTNKVALQGWSSRPSTARSGGQNRNSREGVNTGILKHCTVSCMQMPVHQGEDAGTHTPCP